MRRTVSKRLVESKQTVPHFYLVADVDIEEMLALRGRINQAGAVRLSVNDFVVKAFAQALMASPAANAVWAEDRILRFDRADVGVAVAVEGGLYTPIVREANAKSLSTISTEIRDLAERARDRSLSPGEYQGGSATVSNLGMYGVRQFTAIISPPHATILAVGASQRRPVETPDGGVRFTSQLTVTLSCDHRVVDGAIGAKLLGEFKTILENPLRALL
jgi:pyruvate dehydrogenase E2 component (dihydrolipoamide acetyltransferase)